jgi:hypothetical protein
MTTIVVKFHSGETYTLTNVDRFNPGSDEMWEIEAIENDKYKDEEGNIFIWKANAIDRWNPANSRYVDDEETWGYGTEEDFNFMWIDNLNYELPPLPFWTEQTSYNESSATSLGSFYIGASHDPNS